MKTMKNNQSIKTNTHKNSSMIKDRHCTPQTTEYTRWYGADSAIFVSVNWYLFSQGVVDKERHLLVLARGIG